MKYMLLAALLACSIGGRSAYSQETSLQSSDIRELRDIPYVTDGSDRQKLDLYLPPSGSPRRPLLIWIHGGGWESGSKDVCPIKSLVSYGYVGASIGYRLSQQAIYPAQIEDSKAAIRWLRTHAQEYCIDPTRIGVGGESAGGHLAALLGTTGERRDFEVGENLDQSSRVQCVVDLYGPTDFLHWGGDHPDKSLDRPDSPAAKLLGGLVTTHESLARRASPADFVTCASAPFLILHGSRDTLVPLQQSQELNDALRKVGVESTLTIVPGAGHGGPAFFVPGNLKMIIDFLGRHLQPDSAPK